MLRDRVGYIAGDRDDGGQIAGTRMLAVDGEHCSRQVARVGDGEAGGTQPLDQAGGP